MKVRKLTILGTMLWLFMLIVSSPAVAASIPAQLSLQGVVNDSASGTPIEGTLEVRFTLYDETGRITQYMLNNGDQVDPTGLGASVIWTEVQMVRLTQAIMQCYWVNRAAIHYLQTRFRQAV